MPTPTPEEIAGQMDPDEEMDALSDEQFYGEFREPMVQIRLIDELDLPAEIEADLEKPPEQWRKWYVTAYDSSREYGGPEEGGWYYDAYEVIETREASSYEEAQKIKEQMEDEYLYEKEEGFGGRHVRGKPIKFDHSTRLANPHEEVPDDYEPASQAEDESYVYTPGDKSVVIEREAGEMANRGRPHYE